MARVQIFKGVILMDKENKFKVSNPVIRALKPLGKYDRYLVWYALKGFPEGENTLTVSKRTFMQQFGIEDGSKTREQLKMAMKDMIKKTVIVLDEDISPTGELAAFPLVSTVLVKKDQIYMERPQYATDFIAKIKDNYTWFYIDQLIKLDGLYSPKIYQFARILLNRLNDHKITWEWHIETTHTNPYDSLKSWLNLENSTTYKNFKNIEDKILIPAIKEINEKCSDCHIFYDPTENKRGAKNKVKSITLHIADAKPVEAESEVPIQQNYWYDSIPEAPSLTTATLRKVAQSIVDEMDGSWLFSNRLTATASEAERLRSAITKQNIRTGLLRFVILNYESVRSRGIVIKNKQQYMIGTIKKVFADLNDDYSNYNSTQAQEFLQKLGEAHRLDQKNFIKKFGLKIEKK